MDEKFLYGCSALRDRGVYYFKFDYPPECGKGAGKKIQIINFIELYRAESVMYDKRNNGIFYVADGVSGVTVLDSTNKSQQIQLISTNTVLGWAGKIFQLDGNLNILIVNHHDRGSFASVTDMQNSFLAFAVSNGFRIRQTNSPINLHAQMIRSKDQQSSANLIDIFSPFIQNQKNDNQIFAKNGESVSFTIVPLYYLKGIQFQSSLLYEFQIKQIPNWITFSQFAYTISMIPQILNISPNQGFCVILLDTYLQIYSNNFISEQFKITKEQSANLYNYFGILSQDGYLRSTYDPSVRLMIDRKQIYTNNDIPSIENLQNIYDFVKFTVEKSIFCYLIYIRIFQSLNLSLTNPDGMIETYSSQVIVQLTLVFLDTDTSNQQNRPQFMPQTYNGVLCDLKNQNLQLNLLGILTSVNSILRDQIYIYLPKSIQDAILIQFQIRDEINADIQQIINLSEIPQFKLKAPLLVLSSIQEQYGQQYPGGLFVEQSFQININQNSFKSEAFLQIKYQIGFSLIKNVQIWEGVWRNLMNSDWIRFENTRQSLQLTGQGSLLDLQKSFTLQIIATDRFESNVQTVVAKFSQIPLTIILLYKNLSYFQQIKSQNQKSPKISNSLSLHKVKYTEMLFLLQYIDDEGLPNMNKIILDVLNVQKQNTSKFQKINSSEFNETNNRQNLAIKSTFTIRILQTDRQTLEIFLILKKTLLQKTHNALDWYQQLIEVYGFGQNYKPKRFKPSYGSVIHLNQSQIKDIKIILKDSDQDYQQNGIFKQFCNKIKAILFLNYKKIGQNFHSVQNIRNWLRYQINENYVILQGETQKVNLGEYLIQILNSDKYTVYQYSLQVVLNKSEAAAYDSKQIKQKSKQSKEISQSKNLQKSGAYQKQSIFLHLQEIIEPANHENQIQEEQQSNNILKIIQLKVLKNQCFSEVRIQKKEEINNSSILSYNLNKTTKKDDDLDRIQQLNI
ncbi:hypothetical protein ABPG72_000610 [Tetrahymena utriculariae]